MLFRVMLMVIGLDCVRSAAQTLPLQDWYCEERANHQDSLPMRGLVILRTRIVNDFLAVEFPRCPNAKPLSLSVRPFLRLEVASSHRLEGVTSWTGPEAFRLMEEVREVVIKLRDQQVQAEIEALIDLSCCGPNGKICIVSDQSEKPWGGLISILEIRSVALRKRRL